MLSNNIVRVNGWLRGKRTRADIEVPTDPNTTNWGKGKEIPRYSDDSLIKKCFAEGLLDGVTSINAYNYIGDHRITTKVL